MTQYSRSAEKIGYKYLKDIPNYEPKYLGLFLIGICFQVIVSISLSQKRRFGRITNGLFDEMYMTFHSLNDGRKIDIRLFIGPSGNYGV